MMTRSTNEVNEKAPRILVLGATGFLGRWVASCAMQDGLDVHCALRSPTNWMELRHVWGLPDRAHAVDLLDDRALGELLADIQPDWVFNLAGYGIDREEKDSGLAEALNSELPRRLAAHLEALSARRPGVRLIHTGSALEYGRQPGDLREETPCTPDSLYGRTKYAGTEALCQAHGRGIDVRVARLFTLYGPGEHENRLLPSLMRASREGTAVDLSDGAQKRDFCYVEDVARALLRLAHRGRLRQPLVNLATGSLCTVRDFVLKAAAVFELGRDQLNFGALPRYADEMEHEPVNVSRCREILGAPLEMDVSEGLLRARCFEEKRIQDS